MRDTSLHRRRDVLALGIGAFVVAAVPFAARGRRRAQRLTIPVMGTIADIIVITDDRAHARVALDAAAAELRAVDACMSRFDARSDVGRLNAAPRGQTVSVSADTALVIRNAIEWAERSSGRFDPCLGLLSESWSRSTPDVTAYSAARLYRTLDTDQYTGGDVARLSNEHASLDLGGIAKGHAVDRALRAIREAGIRDALVNAGGDLAAAGVSADGDAWRVGVRDPYNAESLADTLDLRDEAVATSGDYETAVRRDGRTVHHILDPRTATPRETRAGTHSLTVVASDCMTADAAATALFGTTASTETVRVLRGTSARVVSRA